MRVGHGLQVGRVGLRGLALRLLVRLNPGETLGPTGGLRHCRRRHRGRSVTHHHDLLDDLHQDLLHDHFGDARGVGLRPRRRAARRGIRLAVVGAVEREGHRGLLLWRRRGPRVGVPERREVQRHARDGEASEGLLQARHAVLSLAVERHAHVCPITQDAPHQVGENRARTDLHEGSRAARPHGLDLLDEAHRAGDLPREAGAHPVGVRRVRRGLRVGPHHRPRRRKRHPREKLPKLRPGRRHQGAVKGRRYGKPPGRHPLRREQRLDPRDGLLGPGEHHLLRVVVVGHHHRVAKLREHRPHVADGAPHRGHRPGRRRRIAHQLTAMPRDGHQGRLVDHPGRAQRRDLPEAVPSDVLGLHPDGAQHPQEREARHPDGRLGPLRRREPLRLRRAVVVGKHWPRKHHVSHRGVVEARARGVVPDRSRGVLAHRDVPAHADVLAPLPREDERHRPDRIAHRVVHAARRGERRVWLRREVRLRLRQLRREVRRVARDHREARLVRGAEGLLRGARDHAQPRLAGVGRHRIALRREPGGRRVREKHQLRRGRAQPPRVRAGADVLLQRDVEITPAEAEAGHRRAPRVRRIANPRAALCVEVKRALLDGERRVRAIDLDGRRQHLVVQRHHGLEEPGCTSSGLGVTDLRLHRSERAPLPIDAAGLAECDLQPREFRGVPGLRSGSVSLHKLHGLGPVASGLVRPAQRPGLPLRERRIDTLRAPIGGRSDTADDGVHPVAGALGVVEALEGEHRHAFAQQRAVRGVGKRAAVAGLRERRRLAEAHVHEDVVHGVYAARDDQVGLANGEFVDRHGERREGARAGRVGDAVGAAQVEAVGDATRHDVAQQPRKGRLLPRNKPAGDAVADHRRFVFGHARVAQCLEPDRSL